jgi:hypothetical protein
MEGDAFAFGASGRMAEAGVTDGHLPVVGMPGAGQVMTQAEQPGEIAQARMEVMIVERIAAPAAGVGSTNRRAIALQDVVATGTFAAVGRVGVGWLHGVPACLRRPRPRHRIRSAPDPRPRAPRTMPNPALSRTAFSIPCRAADQFNQKPQRNAGAAPATSDEASPSLRASSSEKTIVAQPPRG